jgi:hypothetical protein
MSGENYINHINLVIDASSSMSRYMREVVKVADGQISHLARRSQELDQETRVSIYTFSSNVQCLVYDKDVLRLPSIAKLYDPYGRTALIDATIKSLDDLAHTPELYGDHAFLTFVLTDGEENASRNSDRALRSRLAGLPSHWTVACLVPNMMGKHEAQSFGFPPDNIAIWDADSRQGVEEVGEVIRKATENFMTGRSRGVRGTTSLFSTGSDAVNAATVRSSLTPLDPKAFDIIPVHRDDYIRPFVEGRGMHYSIGKGYYQLMKPETIQSGKEIAIREKSTGRVYTGPQARQLLGLPDMDVKVKPDFNAEYEIYVQSTSVNRRLIKNTNLLVMR